MAYPISYDEGPGGPRSRGLAVTGIFFFIKALILIPHLIILGVLQYAAGVIAWIGFFFVAFTGELPEWLRNFIEGYFRWSARAYSWLVGLTDEYPPFNWDVGEYPVNYAVEDTEERSRGLAVLGIFFPLKFLAALPHILVLAILSFVAFFLVWIGYFIVAFTGELPESLRTFFAGVIRWWIRVNSWIFGLVDAYPPFQLAE